MQLKLKFTFADTESVQWNPIDRRPGIDSDAEIWKSYLNEAAHHDRENITSWNQSMDVMLVFVRTSFSTCCHSLDIELTVLHA